MANRDTDETPSRARRLDSMPHDASRASIAANQRDTPAEGLFLAYAAIVPIGAGAMAALVVSPGWRPATIRLTIIWSAAILSFLAGVRRGDSFHTPARPKPDQLLAVFGTFAASLVALALPRPASAIFALFVGFAGVGLLDALAARRGDAPRFFARIRPPQMGAALLCLAVLLVAVLR
jgi:hypothetical protein